MTERPADLYIEDLAHPVLPPEIAAALGPLEEMAAGLDLSVDGLLNAASQEAGLDGFGAEDFKVRLALILKSLDEAHARTRWGVSRVFPFSRVISRTDC